MLLPKEKLRLLSMVDILEPLSGEELEESSRRIPDTHVEQGQVFYAPGEESDALFMLKRGKVRIYKVAPDGAGRYKLDTRRRPPRGPGACLGQSAEIKLYLPRSRS